jgi:aminopeptidase
MQIPGVRRIGEIGIGTNYGHQIYLNNILFDEKMGGTIHLALGSSYPETGGTNQSDLHWDLLVDMREEGEMYADGKLIYQNGRFLNNHPQ